MKHLLTKHNNGSPVRKKFLTPVSALRHSIAPRSDNLFSLHRKASCACGGGCPACLDKPDNLKVSEPNDAAETEADRIADMVMRMPVNEAKPVVNNHFNLSNTINRKCDACEDEEETIQRKSHSFGSGIPSQSPDHVHKAIGSGGRQLDRQTRSFFERRLDHNLGSVRIHTGDTAAKSALAIDAKAYTLGSNIVFGSNEYKPESESGKHLLAHELAHVVRQSNTIYRRIRPEDVSGQMVGQRMTVASNFNAPAFTVPAGSTVEILTWSNSSETVNVQLAAPQLNAYQPFDIPKTLLRPIPGSSGLHQYSSGIEATVRSINAGDARIAQELSRPGGPRPGEIPRLEGLQRNRQRTLNIRLIQEEMFNRFDANIVNWVNFYNTQFAASSFGNLDANLVKSMLFQESEMGTSGAFMSLTPANREMGIHNLGQVIDSSASALLILIREIEPSLITHYHLTNIVRDTASRPAGVSAEEFMWSYVAAGETQGFQDAVNDFYATAGGGMRDTTYDFWIQAAVRWLFEKRRTVSSWAEAIRAYNGSGARARHYRDAVTGRARDASVAAAGGVTFIPHR